MTGVAAPALVAMSKIITDTDYQFDFAFFDLSDATPHNFAGDDTFDLTFVSRSALDPKITFRLGATPGLTLPAQNIVSLRIAEADAAALKPTDYAFELRRLGTDTSKDLLAIGNCPIQGGLSLDSTTSVPYRLRSPSPSVANIIYKPAGVQVIYPPSGVMGQKGWSPVLTFTTGGHGSGVYITDWIGGEGAKPATGQFVTSVGNASAIAYDDTLTELGVFNVQDAIDAMQITRLRATTTPALPAAGRAVIYLDQADGIVKLMYPDGSIVEFAP